MKRILIGIFGFILGPPLILWEIIFSRKTGRLQALWVINTMLAQLPETEQQYFIDYLEDIVTRHKPLPEPKEGTYEEGYEKGYDDGFRNN